MIKREGAMVVVVSSEGRVLLERREFFVLWDLPGGQIEKGEDPGAAAVRETCEETGYQIVVERAVGTYLHQSVYTRGDQRTYAFRAHVTGGEPKRVGLEITGLRWFSVHALPRGLEPLHRQIISDAISPSAAPVERRIDFPLWKLYPARIVFFLVRIENELLRRALVPFRRLARTKSNDSCSD